MAWKEELKCTKWLSTTFLLLLVSGITDDDLRETAYEVLLACAGATGYASIILFGLQFVLLLLHHIEGLSLNFVSYFVYNFYLLHPLLFLFLLIFVSRGLIVPSKEKKKDKRSKLMRKLGRSRSENVGMQSQRAPGLVGLLETMRVQMEVCKKQKSSRM